LAHLNTKSLPLSLVLVGSVLLAACSSKPSPWAESSSPWDSRQQQTEEVVVAEEATSAETMDMAAVETAPAEESMYAEPVYAESMSGEAMPVEPVYAEPAMMEPAMMEPVAPEEVAPVAMAGDLSAQPAEYFVVQVVASSTMAQLNDFANANSMSSEWVAETNVNGKTWYVLILGVYPTKSEADQALATVGNMGTQPWVRTVGSLQSVMK